MNRSWKYLSAFALLVLLPRAASAQSLPPAYLFSWGNAGSAPGQFNQPEAVAVNSVGDVYVVDKVNQRVQKFDANGNWLAQLTGGIVPVPPSTSTVFSTPTGVAIDAFDNVYVVDTGGLFDSQHNRVVKYDVAGNFILTWGTFGSTPGKFALPCAVTVDPTGAVYVWDNGNASFSIQKFTSSGSFLTRWTYGAVNDGITVPNAITSDLHSNIFALNPKKKTIEWFNSAGDSIGEWGGPGTGNSRFTQPHGIATDAVGNIYVADWGNWRVQVFAPDTSYLAQWCCFNAGGPPPGNTGFYQPEGIAVNAQGDVYVSEWGGRRVDRFGGGGLPFVSAAGVGVLQWGSGLVQQPFGVSLDPAGNIYVADTGNDRIVEFGPSGGQITQWGTTGSGNGQFHGPEGVALNSVGNLYVADFNNNRIEEFSAAGAYVTQWGSPGTGNGQFNHPFGVASDGSNLVDVVDQGNNRIQRFDAAGVFLSAWGSTGSGNGQFNDPYGIAIDANHNVYVADAGNNRIQKFSATGTYLTQWGSLGNQDGQFNGPHAVAVDGAGNVYVSDQGNNRIEKFTSNGAYLTQWGVSGLPVPQGATNDLGSVETTGPDGLAVDGAGNLYLADAVNNDLQKYVNPPEISMIADVPGDAGHRVRLHVHRSSADVAAAVPHVTGYQIYRRIDPAGTSWEEVHTFAAAGALDYIIDASTLVDATAGAINYTAFKVRAITSNPVVYFESAPRSGYSIDNGGEALSVPETRAEAIALAGAWPNPTVGGPLSVQFTLATSAPADLELFDLAGRRVAARDVGSLGAGRHSVELATAHQLATGIYLVRLTQGTGSRVARVAVLN